MHHLPRVAFRLVQEQKGCQGGSDHPATEAVQVCRFVHIYDFGRRVGTCEYQIRILTEPSIVLLNEATLGLDSTSAVALMCILDRLAKRSGKTIVTLIHQPLSAVFFGFDLLMLLADSHVVYFGRPRGSLEHICNLDMAYPDRYNTANHWMDLLVVDSATDDYDKEEEESHDFFHNNKAPKALRRAKTVRELFVVAKGGGASNKQKLISAWDAKESALKINEEFKATKRASMEQPHGTQDQTHFVG